MAVITVLSALAVGAVAIFTRDAFHIDPADAGVFLGVVPGMMKPPQNPPKKPNGKRELRYVHIDDVPRATRVHITNLALLQGYFHDELARMFDITPQLVQEIVEAASPDDIAD